MAKKKNEKTSVWALPLSALLGVALTAAIAAAIVLICGKLAYGTEDPAQYSSVIGAAALYLSTFFGGLFSNAYSGRRFGASVIHAAAVCLVLAITEIAANGTLGQNLLSELLVIPCSLLSGGPCYMKLPKKKKPKFKSRGK